MKRIAGPLITTFIVVGIGGILLMNLDLSPNRYASSTANPKATEPTAPTATAPAVESKAKVRPKGDIREYPIGTEVEKNAIRVSAVWLPPVGMDGNAVPGSDMIHVEADVKATEGNRQGFALGEFVPYLKIHYEIKQAKGGEVVQKGELLPMIASDGLHYGASVAMSKPGEYLLTYAIQPPSAGGLGRHSDPVTGVEPWWEPFQATFEWDFEGLPSALK